jgi:hypothetical protein
LFLNDAGRLTPPRIAFVGMKQKIDPASRKRFPSCPTLNAPAHGEIF